jgi:S-adenosylmethionine/arginine decarboxylase-like enzyme
MHSLDHKHITVAATGLRNVPHLPSQIETWLTRLVAAVEMEVLMEARAVRCDLPGNEGVTGIVCLTTSHASLHIWDSVTEPFLRMDLYSCKNFEIDAVLRMVREFQPTGGSWLLIDRNGSSHAILGAGPLVRS